MFSVYFMTLDAKLNGEHIQYTASVLERLYERLSMDHKRHFYTKRDGNILRLDLAPAYFSGDMFSYKATVSIDERDISTRLSEPKKETLDIFPLGCTDKIAIDRNMRRGSTLVKRIAKDNTVLSTKKFSLDELDEIERYVRGLY